MRYGRIVKRHQMERIVTELIAYDGIAFEVTPYPDDEWRVMVKDENRKVLDQIANGWPATAVDA